MTRVKADETADGTKHKPAPARGKKMHLREVRSVQAEDGSIVHHHTYADSKDAKFPHPERQNVATSTNAEEAGQHVADMFGQNGMGGGGVNEEAEPAGQGAEPPAAAAAPQQAAPPEE